MSTEERIKYILEGEDRASSVFGKVASSVKDCGAIIVATGAAAGAALLGLGAGMVHLAADSEPLVGVRKAFNDLTADVEGGSMAMLSALRESSYGWVTNADLMKSYNQASSLVGEQFARQLPEAMGYLSKVAASTGMDMNYMLDSLVRGVGRLSPLILDNLGIQASLGEATERAAEMFGKEAEELSKSEQQAGMMNVIMEKLAENTAKMELPEKSFASFGVTLENLRHELGEKLVPLLSPFVDLLSKVATAVGEWLARALEKVSPFIERFGDAFSWLFDILEGQGLGAIFDAFEDGSSILGTFFEKLGFAEKTAEGIADVIIGIKEALDIFNWALSGDELLDWSEAGSRAPEWLRDVTYWVSNLALDIKELIQPIVDWIKQNVELKDVLIALGIAVAAFVLPILFSIIMALAPIILAFGGLILIVTLVRKAWEENWGGIRDKLTEAWENTIRPALEALWAWLQEKIPEAIAKLKQFWEETLLPALQKVWEFIQTNVIPALQAIWAWLKEKIPEAIAAAKEFWEEKLKPALEKVWEFIETKVIPALQKVWEWLKEKVPEAIQKAKEFWEEKLKPALEKVWAFIQDNVIPIIQSVVAWLQENIPIAIERAREFWEEKLLPALETVWAFIQDNVIPIIESVVEWLKEKIPEAIAKAKEFWEEKLKPALEVVWEFIDEHVLPLLTALWELFKESLNKAVEKAADIWENTLKPALEKVWEWIDTKVLPVVRDLWEWFEEKITPATDTFKKALNGLKIVLDKIGGVLDWVRGLIEKVTAGLKGVKTPDHLTGHSPSPFEKSLAGIQARLVAVNEQLAVTRYEFDSLSRMNLSPTVAASWAGSATSGASQSLEAGPSVTHNYYLTANYAYREEQDLIDDLRTLELIHR